MHDSYYDHNHCSVLSYCFIMAFLNWKDSRVSILFCPANAPSFYVFAGRGRKGVSRGEEPPWASIPAANARIRYNLHILGSVQHAEWFINCSPPKNDQEPKK